MNTPTNPGITGVHHVCLTVTDLDASMNWYQQLFQAERWPGQLPHYAREETGFAEMLAEPHTGLLIGLHHHRANRARSSRRATRAWTTSHSRSLTGRLWKPGWTGSMSSTSGTPESAGDRTARIPPSCSATP